MIRPTGHGTSSADRDAYDASAGHVCPFCGLTREITADFDPASPCPRCTLSDTPQTRNATKLRVGPWHVRQVRNPWAPGMRFETLLALVKRAQVTRDSIVRGPTTFQLWRRAGEIRGLSREFGLCYSCAGELDPQANVCPHCNRSQDPPANPDALIETREVAPPAAAARPAAPNPDDPPSLDIASSTPRPSPTSDPADLLAVTDEPRSAPPAPGVPDKLAQANPVPVIPAPPAPPAPPAQAKPAAHSAPPPLKSQRPEKPPARKPAAEPTVEPPSKRPPHEIAAEQGAPDEKPAAEKDRPIPIRPRTPGAEDALLTPQELAAAFQLDFSPPGSERRGGSKLAAALLVVLLLAGGAAALFYLRPDFRERALAWTSRQWTAAKQLVTSRKSPAAPQAPASGPRAAPATRPGSLVMDQPVSPLPATRPKPIAIAPPPAPEPAPPPEPTEEQVADASPAPSPASVPASGTSPAEPRIVETPVPPRRDVTERAQDPASTAPSTEQAAAAVTTTQAPDPPSIAQPPAPRPPPALAQSPRPSPPPAPAPAVKKSPDPSEAYAEARRLLGKALDAEENQDYVEAVRCYEAIKRLPVDARAMGIDVRIQRARKLVQ